MIDNKLTQQTLSQKGRSSACETTESIQDRTSKRNKNTTHIHTLAYKLIIPVAAHNRQNNTSKTRSHATSATVDFVLGKTSPILRPRGTQPQRGVRLRTAPHFSLDITDIFQCYSLKINLSVSYMFACNSFAVRDQMVTGLCCCSNQFLRFSSLS